MMSPLDTVVSEFSEKYGKKAQELINALMIYIHQGWDLNKAVNQALIDVNLNDFLTDNIEQAIAKSADIGAGINRKAGIPLLKPLESSWDGSGMKLSQKLHSLKKNIHLQVTDTIKAQLALNNNVSKISRELYDGYNTNKAVIERQSLPQYITKVISFARRSDLSDYERRQLLKLCRKTRAKVDKLSEGGAPNKALKTSYNKLLDAVESSKEHAICKAVTTAVEEKSRYVAERIARTEAARAWQDGFLQKYDGNDRVIAYKWKLSGRHPIFDICDMYAKADMYGLGKGIFPKDKVPSIPVHPHCLCHLVPVYKTELKGKQPKENIQEAGEKWLKALPKQEQYKVLGMNGLKAWQNGADWRNYIKNYSTQVAQTRLKDLNIKPKNDIIKEKIEELAKKYKIKFEQVKYPPEKLKIPFDELSFDDKHINKERKHNVTREEAEKFIGEALCTLIRWQGQYHCYMGSNGSVYINIRKKLIRTTYKRKQYDDDTLSFIEGVEKYGVKGN